MSNIYECEFCKKPITEEDYFFSDICSECLNDPNRSDSYE